MTLFAAVALVACSYQGSLTRSQGAASTRAEEVAAAEFEQKLQQQEQQNADVAKQMPLDYRDCVLPVLLDQMRETGTQRSQHLYVTVLGHDMDAYLKAALASRGVIAFPLSALTHKRHGADPFGTQMHTSNWEYFVGHLAATPLGQYRVDAAYHCGGLCAGAFRYSLKIVEKACTITSKEMLWIS